MKFPLGSKLSSTRSVTTFSNIGVKITFLKRILETPSYGYEKNGRLHVPTRKVLFREFFARLKFFSDRRNWLAAFSWGSTLAFGVPLALFLAFHLSFWLFLAGFFYSMVVLGTHATVWYHRYSTHRAFRFRNSLWRFLVKNAVVKVVVEEIYVVSHHVHHGITEKPGDPYNVHGGWLYCFLADANHQPIAKQMSEQDYKRVTVMLEHTGIRMHDYAGYLRWGSISRPLSTALHFGLNWLFWYGIFFLVGGHALALALFGSCGVWAIGIRTYNFDGHGAGKDKRKIGIDFNRQNLSINQYWPGLVTGEWHSNHHLYPNGARAGFLPYQLDYAWYSIWCLSQLGGVSSYRDYKAEFLAKYHRPHLANNERINALRLRPLFDLDGPRAER